MKNSSLFKKWTRSTLIVTMTMLVIFFSLCLYLLRSLRASTMQTAEDIALYMASTSDSRILEIQKNVNSLALNPVTVKLKQSGANISTDQTDIYRFCDSLNNLRINSNLIKEILIYYPDADIITGSLGYYTAAQYEKLQRIRHFCLTSNIPYWELSHHDSSFLLEENKLFYFYELMNGSRLTGCIVVELDVQELLSSLIFSNEGNRRNLSVLGMIVDGKTIYSESGTKTQDTIDSALDILINQAKNYIRRNGLLIFCQTSLFSRLQYFVGFPEDSVFRPLYLATLFCGLGIILLLLIGVLFSLCFSSRHTRPIQNLISKLSEVSGNPPLSEDAYEYITHSVDDLLDERHINMTKINSQQIIIDDLFLNHLLQGNMHSEHIIFREAGIHNIIFEYPMFQTAVIHIPAEYEQTSSTDILNYCQKQKWSCMVGFVLNNYVLLFNTETAYEPAERICDLEQMIQALWPGKPIVWGIGRAYDSLVDIYTSYCEALSSINNDQSALPTAQKHTSSRNSSMERARRFIQENIADPMLGSYLVAEYLGVSNSYLSSNFKKKFGTGVVQYINQLRVEKAKELIYSTDYRIKDIATMVGFSSDISFIRVFKQYENCTPASLRK